MAETEQLRQIAGSEPTRLRRLARRVLPKPVRQLLRWVERTLDRRDEQRPASPTFAERLRTARALRHDGDLPAALTYYDDLLREDSRNAGLWAEAASAYNRAFDRDAAMTAYRKALDIGGPNGDWYARLGLVQVAARDYRAALKNLRRAEKIRPLDHREAIGLLKAHARLALYDESVAFLHRSRSVMDTARLSNELYSFGLKALLVAGDDESLAPWLEHAPRMFDSSGFELTKSLLPHMNDARTASRLLAGLKGASEIAPDDALVHAMAEIGSLHHARVKVFGEDYELDEDTVAVDSPLVAFWNNNRDATDSEVNFDRELIEAADEFGYVQWPTKFRQLVRGKRVLDVGGGDGLHGIGFVINGAKQYVGIDPLIDLTSTWARDKGDSTVEYRHFPATPIEIMRRIPRISLINGTIGEIESGQRFDVAVLHNVTEHLMDVDGTFRVLWELLEPDGTLVFHHHNFYAWDGHHQRPKRVSDVDWSNSEHLQYVDWAHLDFQAPDGHYFRHGLNKVRMADLRSITERYFEIDQWKEILPTAEQGLGRLTDEIARRHPQCDAYELTVKNVLCVARRRGSA